MTTTTNNKQKVSRAFQNWNHKNKCMENKMKINTSPTYLRMKPRNHVAIALAESGKHSGAHEKSKKALRRQSKVDLRTMKYED